MLTRARVIGMTMVSLLALALVPGTPTAAWTYPLHRPDTIQAAEANPSEPDGLAAGGSATARAAAPMPSPSSGGTSEQHANLASQSLPDSFADLGNTDDEAEHNLVGWGDAQIPPENPYVAPSGDNTKRYQELRADNSVDLVVSETNVPYLLTAEVEDGRCTDNFELYINGEGPIYQYEATTAWKETAYAHRVPVAGHRIPKPKVTVTFRNTSTDDCGLAAVYNVGLSRLAGTTYSISGQVHDGGANAVPDVTVSAGTGGFDVTDSGGTYTIKTLVTGTYTLTPTKNGWSFTPPTCSVRLPPDATGVDFVGTRTTQTTPPELLREDPLHAVVLRGVVTAPIPTSVWFEWGEDPNLTTYEITGTKEVVGIGVGVTATLQLPSADSVGRPFYYRMVAGDRNENESGRIQRILILLGGPDRFPSGTRQPPYWNKYDRLIHYYAHQAGWPAPVVKAVLAHESHWDFYDDDDGHFNEYPEHNFLYEPVTVDWAKVYQGTSAPRVDEVLNPYLLPDNPPAEWPYNRYWDTVVPIPSGAQNLDMVGRCSFRIPDLGNQDPYPSTSCTRWREVMNRTHWSRSVPTTTYRKLYGITNPAISSETASQILSLTAQYRLASSYGLGQVVYLSHHDRMQRIWGDSSPPAPETLYTPELNIRVALDYLEELRRRPGCGGSDIDERKWDNQDDWERAVRGYNDGKCNMTGYTERDGFSHILSLLSASSPVLAPADFDAGGILVPKSTSTMATTGVRAFADPGEFEVDRLVADVKGLGQDQLMLLSAVVTNPDWGVDHGRLTIFTDAAGSAVEWESLPLEGVLASGAVLTETLTKGGPPLIATLWGAGAHGTRACLFRWDGQTYHAIHRVEADSASMTDFFGDAGVDIGGDSVMTVSRDGESPLSVFHANAYAWDTASQTFEWVREETFTNDVRLSRVYLPLVLRSR